MAIFLKCKNSLSSRLTSLTSSQGQMFAHTITEQKNLSRGKKEDYDAVFKHNFVIEMSKWKKIDANRLGVYRSKIPPPAWAVLKKLHDRGFPAFVVGGCVRDFLLNKVPKDIDVVTTARLKQVKRIFNRCLIVGKKFPICRVEIFDSVVEVSSFSTEAKHSKEKKTQLLPKRPVGCDKTDFICWKDSIRRDFTINSLFFDPFENKICDFANGMEDIRTLKLRTLKPAHLSFQEDCARILRGLRIAGRLGLTISKDTESAIFELGSSIKNLEKGRIMMELNYMLAYGAAESSIYLLRRFNLLELFLPFHAAYLDQQFSKASSRSSVMLMKMLFNLDKLVACDRPCHCNLWLGLLAFHQALVTKPQDAFVVWVFASVLYHGSWREGVKFARKTTKLQVNFVPEFTGFSDTISDDELSEEVSHLAALAQDSIGALADSNVLDCSLDQDQGPTFSGLEFVSKKITKDVAHLFDVLRRDIETYEQGRESFVINDTLLGKGMDTESRFALGEIILKTLSDRCEATEEEMEKKYGPTQSNMVLHRASVSGLKHKLSDLKYEEKIPKIRKVVKRQSLAEENKIIGEVTKKCQDITREDEENGVRVKHGKKQVPKKNMSGNEENNRSDGEKIKSNNRSQGAVKEKSSRTSLSSLFRR